MIGLFAYLLRITKRLQVVSTLFTVPNWLKVVLAMILVIGAFVVVENLGRHFIDRISRVEYQNEKGITWKWWFDGERGATDGEGGDSPGVTRVH